MHIIEVTFTDGLQAKAFLSALYYSDFVLPVGYRYVTPQRTIAAAIDFNQNETSDLDFRISEMIDKDSTLDESEIYLTKIYPETTPHFN